MEKLFILSGKPRHGKDTFASLLEKNYKNKKVLKLSYGKYPKYYVKEIFGWNGKDETKPRTKLQEISMKAREKNPNYMVRRMEEDINILKNYADIIIITDARLKEEVEMPKKKFKDAISIKIIRPDFISTLTKEEQSHILETALDDYSNFDYIIKNDGDILKLEKKALEIIGGIK